MKSLKIHAPAWEFWLFVLSLVTILGFFAKTHTAPETNSPYFLLQSKAEVYDIRVPNNSRIVQDRLETGR